MLDKRTEEIEDDLDDEDLAAEGAAARAALGLDDGSEDEDLGPSTRERNKGIAAWADDLATDGQDAIIQQIIILQGDRRYLIKLQIKMNNALIARIMTTCTLWRHGLTQAEIAPLWSQAEALVKQARKQIAAEAAKLSRLPVAERHHFMQRLTADVLLRPVYTTDKARLPFDRWRSETEAKMEACAERLLVWPRLETIKGFSSKFLAIIVAEARGDLNRFVSKKSGRRCHQALWKMLGFDVYDDKAGSTRRKFFAKKYTDDEWSAHGFNAQRYAEIFSFADVMSRHQLIGKAKTADGRTAAKGPYGKVYVRRYARTEATHPEWQPKRRQLDALRVMAKALIKDVWREWRKTTN